MKIRRALQIQVSDFFKWVLILYIHVGFLIISLLDEMVVTALPQNRIKASMIVPRPLSVELAIVPVSSGDPTDTLDAGMDCIW